jgi:hypothetical protein
MIAYTAATQSYRVTLPNNVTDTFSPSERDGTAPANVLAYSRSGGSARLEIVRPEGAGAAFDYSRSAFIRTSGGATSGTQIQTTAFCVLGVPTLTTDIPNTAIVNFTRFSVRGEAFDRRSGTLETFNLNSSLVTMTVDVSAGVFVSVIRLIGTNASGVTRELGTYTVQGSLDPMTAGFFGSGFQGGAPAPGVAALSVNGGFFGPQGREFGYQFNLSQNSTPPPGQPGDLELLIVGTISGER